MTRNQCGSMQNEPLRPIDNSPLCFHDFEGRNNSVESFKLMKTKFTFFSAKKEVRVFFFLSICSQLFSTFSRHRPFTSWHRAERFFLACFHGFHGPSNQSGWSVKMSFECITLSFEVQIPGQFEWKHFVKSPRPIGRLRPFHSERIEVAKLLLACTISKLINQL